MFLATRRTASSLAKVKVRKRLEEIGKLGHPIADTPSSKPRPSPGPERAAIAEIKKLGARVGYCEERSGRLTLSVYLGGTQVTDADINELEKVLPDCRISH